MSAQPAPVENASLAPGELALAGVDGTVTLWDVASGTRLANLSASRADVHVVFAPDGDLVTARADGTLERWDVRFAQWRARACAVAGRTLTRAEWQAVQPGRAYVEVCR